MRRVLPLLAVLCLAFAPAPFPRRERERLAPTDVKGTWLIESWVENGRPEPYVARQYVVHLTRDKYDFVSIKGEGTMHFKLVLHPDVKPHGFELRCDGHPGFVGSYRLEREKLTLIFTSGGKFTDRPTDFNRPAPVRFIMRRIRRD